MNRTRPTQKRRYGHSQWIAGLLGLLVMALPIAGAIPAVAADGEERPALTLEEALDLTLQHSPRVQRAESAARQSVAAEEEAQSIRRPRLDLLGGLDRTQNPMAGAPDPTSQVHVTLSYQQTLAEMEDTRLSLEQARLRTDMAMAQKQRETLDALSDVLDAYVNVLEAESSLQLSEVLARNAAEAERVVYERFQQGAATEVDWLAAQTAADRASQGVSVARSSLRLAYEALYRSMGVPVPDPLPRLQPVEQLTATIAFDEELQELLAYALESHPDMVQAQRALEAARIGLRQVERADRPQLELSGEYDWLRSGQRVSFNLDDNARLGVTASHAERLGDAPQLDRGDTWRVGAQVRFNLTDAGAGASREEQAREQVRQAELQLEELTAALYLVLAREYDQMVQAWQDVAIHDAERLEAERRHDIMRTQFETGSATLLDLWRAEGQVVTHHTEWVRAQGKVLRARMALALAAGVDEGTLIRMFAVNGD